MSQKKIQEFHFESKRQIRTEMINLLYLVLKGGKKKKGERKELKMNGNFSIPRDCTCMK